jgi:rhodanese-related sulfurtransferase
MLKEIDAKTLHDWMEDGKAVLIDVREVDEYAHEHIIGSRLVPLSAFDKADFKDNKDKVAVFHCRTGNRTCMAAPQLLQTGFADVYHLDGGIEAWKKAGYSVHYDASQPISIMRQVQLTAGSLVLIGAILAILVSPWFALLSGFVGGGLMMAGFTGSCPMANMLAVLPFNRRAMTAMGDTTGHAAQGA